MTRINAQIEADQYQIRVSDAENGERSEPVRFSAFNITQNYAIEFGADSARVVAAQRDPGTSISFQLNGWGYQDDLTRAGPAVVKAEGTRVEYQRPGITEWYENGARGLEQGFTLHRRPSDRGVGPIQVSMALDQSLNYRIEQQGQTLIAAAGNGDDLFRYDHLLAWDSEQKPLAATMTLSAANELVIAVDDADAIYPVTIDPLISNIDHLFRGTYSSRKNDFGRTVAIDGDTAVVGAPRDERLDRFHGTGAVYVFYRNQGGLNNWGQVKKLAPLVLRPGDEFGAAVALSGDLLVVGAPGVDGADGLTPEAGAIYFFERDAGAADNWGSVKTIESILLNEQFGTAVAISSTGDTLAVGAPFGFFATGAAYIYGKDEGAVDNWGEVRQVSLRIDFLGFNEIPEFGTSLSIDGDSLVVGAPHALNPYGTGTNSGVAVLFERNQGGTDNWGEVITVGARPTLEFSDTRFGEAVSILGDSFAVGFPGDDEFSPTSLDRGSVYIYDRDYNGIGTWGEGLPRIVLTAPSPAAGDNFGIAVSMRANSLLVGASGAGNGSVFRHDRDNGGADNWGLTDTFIPSDGLDGASFGSAIARQGGTILIGGPSADDSAGSNSGGVYVFDGLSGPLAERTKLSGNNLSDSNTGFGQAVAIDDTTVAIAAPADDDTGAVFVFYKDEGGPDNWGQVARLVGADSSSGDKFGFDLDLDGDLLAVSALNDVEGYFPNTTLGSVYIFGRNVSGLNSWGQVKKLVYADTSLGGLFGQSVSLSNDTLVVGRINDSTFASNHGSAYVYQRDVGGPDNWGLAKKLLSSDLDEFDRFGESVAIDGDTIAVGAPFEDQATDSGAVYVFYRDQDGADKWGEIKRVQPLDGAAFDFFGTDLAIQGDELIVGAPGNGAGTAYFFKRNSGGPDTWGETTVLEPSFGAGSTFGSAVDLDGDLAIVGDPGFVQGGGFFSIFSRNRDGIDAWGRLSAGSFLDMRAPPDEKIGTDVAIQGRTLLLGSAGGSFGFYDTSGIALLRNLALPPQVVKINTDLASDDGVLSEGELLGVAVSALSVEFDQSMVSFLAQSVSFVKLLDHGPDELLDTGAALCQSGAQPGGDDFQVPASNIVYNTETFTMTFDVPGPLTSRGYTLILCPGLVSTDGFQLDGNGDASEGDAFLLSFGIRDTDGDNDPDFSDPDDDGDGMDDTFEIANGLDPLDAGDAGIDQDGDLLTNLEEFNINPLLDPFDPDTDGDGIDDALDDEPIVSNNFCSGAEVDFKETVMSELTCAADTSITVNPPAEVQDGSGIHLRLIAPKIVFTSEFNAGGLTVITAAPCAACAQP